MLFLTIEKTLQGWRIKEENNIAIHYIGYSEREAVAAYRKAFNLQHKQLFKLYI